MANVEQATSHRAARTVIHGRAIGRRAFSAGALGCAIVPGLARAQQPSLRVRRIGFLSTTTPEGGAPTLAALLGPLEQLGWVERRNLIVDQFYLRGQAERAAEIADQVLALKPEVILSTGDTFTLALLARTRTVPVIFVQVPDPVFYGYVESLARPGGNATGLTNNTEVPFVVSQLALLKEWLPALSRIGYLALGSSVVTAHRLSFLKQSAEKLGVEVQLRTVTNAADIAVAFEAARAEGDSGMIVQMDVFLSEPTIRRLVVAAAERWSMPAAFEARENAEAGGLMSYGANRLAQYHRAAVFVDKILRGAKPADLPVEQPMTFDFVINRKTANALGLTIPERMLVFATEVIE
jgi:putative ABC transport system substrate-binding protein